MAEGLNRVMLLGNLGADPELKVTQGGQAILKLRLATTERYKDKSEQWQERTEWHSVTVWGRRGEALAKILGKGSTIFVEGSLRTSSYEKDGEKRYRTEVIANNIILAGRRGGGASDDTGMGSRQDFGERRASSQAGGGGPSSNRQDSPQNAPQNAGGFEEYSPAGDDEIPF